MSLREFAFEAAGIALAFALSSAAGAALAWSQVA